MLYSKDTLNQQFSSLRYYTKLKYEDLQEHYQSNCFLDYNLYDSLESNIKDEHIYMLDRLSNQEQHNEIYCYR